MFASCSVGPGMLRGNLLVKSFPKFEKVLVDHTEFCSGGKDASRRLSLGGRCKFLLPITHGNCHKREGAGRVVGYSGDDGARISRGRSAADETLEKLEWPSLCAAVAEFASTVMGKELCQELTLPSTKEDSQELLDETSAALEIDSLLGGVLDFGALQTPAIRGGLDRASKGVVLSGKEFAEIANLLQIAQTLQRGVASLLQDHKSRQDLLQPISKLVEPIIVHQDLYKLIWSKVDEDGTVRDTASAQLRQARIQLQELLNKLARENSGAEDAQDVIDVDGRLCLMISANKANSIPGLLFQQSGSTAYLEPSQAVPLNNKLAEARAEVQKAEYDVLTGIAVKLVPLLNDVQFILHNVVQLDMIAARGKYSSWIGGTKPVFVKSRSSILCNNELDYHEARSMEEELGSREDHQLILNLRKARHPLLVQQHYHAVRKAKAKLKAKVKFLGRMRARSGNPSELMKSSEAEMAEAEAEVSAIEGRAPVPIDVQITRGTRVVAITGPNTGGKTATIKTIGLAALMAKAGLYVLAKDPVYIPFFDSVFADIGDEQSLSQSLSTFSGHLLRIKQIRSESTEESLVLLDEVGAGTDPTEGAALGMALLESFAEDGTGGSLLTLATTHHGELKTLKYSDNRFENASVEFDEERLAPTFKLLWGIPGRSNALNIARRLSLSNEVLAKAQSLYGAANTEVNEVIMRLEQAKLDFDQSREESEILTLEIKEFHSQLVAAAERFYEYKKLLHLEKCDQLAAIAASARSKLSAIARKQTPQISQSVEASTVCSSNKLISQKEKGTEQTTGVILKPVKDMPLPSIGQYLYVPKLGRDVKVVDVNTARKEITVQSGFLQIKVGLKDLQ